MEYRKLGKTEISVSAVALGCWAFGGDGPWGPQDDEDSIGTVSAALDAGINFFDTAEGYGPEGRSESVLGKALAGRRQKAIIATKAGPWNLAGSKVPVACENSLRRLQTDYIDLYQIHWPNHSIPIEETVEALEKLRQQGKIRAIGVSNFGVRDLAGYLAHGRCETNQMSYSMIWRALEYEILPFCREQGVGIICWGPLSEGMLTGKYRTADEVPTGRRATRYFSKDRPETSHGEEGSEKLTFATIDRIRRISNRIGQPMSAVALAWLLHQPGVTAVLAGGRRPEQILQNARAGDLMLSPESLAELTNATEELKQALGANQDMYLTAGQSRIV